MSATQPPARGARARAALAVILAGLVLFGLSSATWFSAVVPGAVQGEVEVAVSGAEAAPALGGVALVLLAAGAALGLVGPGGRRVVGLVVGLAGTAGTAVALLALRSPGRALQDQVAEATGVGVVPEEIASSPVGPVTALACLAVLALGLRHALGRGSWPRPGSRHVRVRDARATTAVGALEDPALAWDALSEGGDPSEDAAAGTVDPQDPERADEAEEH